MSNNQSPSTYGDPNIKNTKSNNSNKLTVSEPNNNNQINPIDSNASNLDDDDTIEKGETFHHHPTEYESKLESTLIKNNKSNSQFQVSVYIKHIIKFCSQILFNSIVI